MTDEPDTDEGSEHSAVTRRALIAAVGVAGAGASGFVVGSASAAPTGVFPESTDDPLLRLRADRIRMIPRTSDPSSPAGGTMWVVE